MVSSLSSKIRTKTSRQVVKSNFFVPFLEETLTRKNHFEFVWPLTKTVTVWHRKLTFGCASLCVTSVVTPVSLPLLESSSTVVVQCYATWTIGHKLRKFWWDFSGENACRTDNCWCHLNLQMGKGNNFKMAVVHSMYVFVERGTTLVTKKRKWTKMCIY